MALGPPYPNDSCDLFHKMRRNVKGITNKIQKDVQKKLNNRTVDMSSSEPNILEIEFQHL